MPTVSCFGMAREFPCDPETRYHNTTCDFPRTPWASAFLVVTLLQHIFQWQTIWKWWPGKILQIPTSEPCISRQRIHCPEGITSRYHLQLRATCSTTLKPGILETSSHDLSRPTLMVFNDDDSLSYTFSVLTYSYLHFIFPSSPFYLAIIIFQTPLKPFLRIK